MSTSTLKKESRGRKKLPKSEKKKVIYAFVKGIYADVAKKEIDKIVLKYNEK